MLGPRWGWRERVPTRGRTKGECSSHPPLLNLQDLGLNKALHPLPLPSWIARALPWPAPSRPRETRATFRSGPQKSGLVEHRSVGTMRKHLQTCLPQATPLWRPSDLEVIGEPGADSRSRSAAQGRRGFPAPRLRPFCGCCALSLGLQPPSFPLFFPKSQRKGLNRKRVNWPGSGGGSASLSLARGLLRTGGRGAGGRGRLGCRQAGQRPELSPCHLPRTGAGSMSRVAERGRGVHGRSQRGN